MGSLNCANYHNEKSNELVFYNTANKLLEDNASVSFLEDAFQNPNNLKKLIKLQKLFRKHRTFHVNERYSPFMEEFGEVNFIPDSFTKAKTEINSKIIEKEKNCDFLTVTKTIDMSINSRVNTKNIIGNEQINLLRKESMERQFETEKFTKTFENFFISNSHKPRHSRNYSIPTTLITSSPTKTSNFEHIVEKILDSEREKTELIHEEIKKAIVILKLLNKRESKKKLLNKRNFFRVWKDKCKKNILLLKQESLRKFQTVKETKLKKLFKRISISQLLSCFNKWKQSSMVLKTNKNLAMSIIKNLIIFKSKYIPDKYFQKWILKYRLNSDRSNFDKLRTMFLSKICQKFSNRKNLTMQKEFLAKWNANTTCYLEKLKKVNYF